MNIIAPQNREITETKTITNPTAEDFHWTFNSQPVMVKANSSTTLREDIANLVGKHLVNHIMGQMDDPNSKLALNPDGTRQKIGNVYTHPLRPSIEATVFTGGATMDVTASAPAVDNPKRKPGRPKKDAMPGVQSDAVPL